jgi:hypothetical protein
MAPRSSARPVHTSGWVYEEKVGGWRPLGLQGRFLSRNGVDHEWHFPDVAGQPIAARWRRRPLALDGEVSRPSSRPRAVTPPPPPQLEPPTLDGTPRGHHFRCGRRSEPERRVRALPGEPVADPLSLVERTALQASHDQRAEDLAPPARPPAAPCGPSRLGAWPAAPPPHRYPPAGRRDRAAAGLRRRPALPPAALGGRERPGAGG